MRTGAVVVLSVSLLVGGAGAAAAVDPPAGRFPQTITMTDIPDTVANVAVVVDATASSMLPVDISLTGSCDLQQIPGGQRIVATAPGPCQVTATQAGDDRWLPAAPVEQEFLFLGEGLGVKLSNAGPGTYIAAQGLELSISVRIESDEPEGVVPSGTILGRLHTAPGQPECAVCEPVSAVIDEDGVATLEIPGSVTAIMPTSAYFMAIDYAGDDFYGSGHLVLPDVHVVTPGDVYGGDEPIIVSMGDSYISGEGGRWAGNAFAADEAWRTDTNPNTYNDQGGYAESIRGCHRSASAEIHIEQAGARVLSINLACSGAETSTDATGRDFKPGIDFYQDENRGFRGQAIELYRLASANPDRIDMIVLSIGGNDFGFGDIVQTCMKSFIKWQRKCSRLPEVQRLFDTPNVELQLANIVGALDNIADAMTEAGYTTNQWTLLQQDYPSPVPGEASKIRYPETLERVTSGGCGMYDADLAYANKTALGTINKTVERAGKASGLPNVEFLDLTDAYIGNRLCEKGVGLVTALGDVTNWTDDGAALGSEWVASVRILSLAHDGHPYWLQESLHPSYWGQLANQVCVKMAWNGGDVQGGKCVRGNGTYDAADGTHRTYPKMTLLDG